MKLALSRSVALAGHDIGLDTTRGGGTGSRGADRGRKGRLGRGEEGGQAGSDRESKQDKRRGISLQPAGKLVLD